jgi:Mg-chelatase subunit ChlD
MPAARSDPALALVAGLVGDSQPNGQDREGLAELLAGTSGAFQKVIGGLRRQGLDIVLVMDATNSMAPYIEQAKSRLRQIIGVTTALLSAGPMDSSRGSVRFGVVAYKDYGDEYGLSATRELPLTEDVDRVQAFIEQITAGGGGDEPEPIHEAIRAAADPAMGWKRGRRALIVLVADAPVHAMARQQAVQAAEDFARRHRGTINVIDVGGAGQQGARTSVLDDLNRIAAAAGGSAFLLRDEDRFWTHLVVSVFGHQFEQDVQTIVERYGRGSP